MQRQLYTTYSTQREALVGSPLQRASLSRKDQHFLNCYPEKISGALDQGGTYHLCQRPGMKLLYALPAGVGRGMYFYNGAVYSVIDNVLYRNLVAVQTLSTSTGAVGFQEFSTGTVKYLIILDGLSGWVMKADNTITRITSVNFPSPHIPQAAYIDGYLCIAKANTDDIYNCVLLDPFTWNAGDYTTAEMFPDNIVALCRQNNYVVAVGVNTTEYFYDAGVFPGTPLQRNSAALHQIGCPAPDTMVQVEEQLMFVGQVSTGGRSIWVMNGFQPSDIAIEPVRQALDGEGIAIRQAKAFVVRTKGHRFYVLNLSTTTWVYDFEEHMWHNWADVDGINRFPCDVSSDYSSGEPCVLDRANGFVYTLQADPIDSIDQSTDKPITTIITTRGLDFGNYKRKFMSRFSMICDVPANVPFTLEWSDDDYQNWSTPRSVIISDTMPTTTQLGSFRRRAFRITYKQPYAWRCEEIEVDINSGVK